MSDLMVTQEIAACLRIKEHKIYDLVPQRGIPCTRVGSKWTCLVQRALNWFA
jgi:putative molybdopterin biosynthesis protein